MKLIKEQETLSILIIHSAPFLFWLDSFGSDRICQFYCTKPEVIPKENWWNHSMNQPKKGANQTKFLKVIIYPLSVNQRYRGFVSAVKFLPGARIKSQLTHIQVEIDAFSLTGQTFNLVFVIFSGLAPQNLKEDDFRVIRLESTAADIVVGLHSPDAEPELYPYAPLAKTTSLGILEGIKENLDAQQGTPPPLFIINFCDSDDEGQKALAFTSADHVCTAPATFKMEHLLHCLQLMNMSLNQEKVEKYTNLAKVPPPYGGWFNDQFAPPASFGVKDLKVLFCGAAGVGKKATISQFANKAMSDNVGASTNKSIPLVGGGSIPVTMTFSAAMPPPADALGIDACVVMYSNSLANVEETINAVKARGVHCILCCNKRDEATGDQRSDGMELAKRLGCLFLESSAKDYDRVAQIFTLLLLTSTGGGKGKGGAAKPASGSGTGSGGKGKGGGGRGCTLF
jgi:uncharacterized membrane protein YgcG